MSTSLKDKNQVIDILRSYKGENPYILKIKKDVVINQKTTSLTDFSVEYVLKNHERQSLSINKTVKIADWYGENLQTTYNIEFKPEKIKILYFLGETNTNFHCSIKYRQNMEPILIFIPKKAVLNNFLVEDFHNLNVDFSRYDRLADNSPMFTKTGRVHHLAEHQKEGIKFLLSRKKCILADDMGLGKTTQLVVSSIEGNYDVILVICPASLKTNWKDELMWYVPERDITIIDGFINKNKAELEQYLGYAVGKSNMTIPQLQKEAKEKGKWSENRYVIVNYDILNEFYEIPATRSKENIEKAYQNSPLLQFLINKKSLVIIDESHKLSNLKSGQYKIIKDLLKRANVDSLFLVTGTPITNDPENYFNMLALIGDSITDDWNYYMKRYCGAKKIPYDANEKAKRDKITQEFCQAKNKKSWFDLDDDEKQELSEIVEKRCKMRTIFGSATNTDELKDRTSHLYLRRVKEDLGSLNVKKYVHEIFYDFDMAQSMEYCRLWDEYERAQLELDPTKEINKELLEGAIYRKYCSNQMIPHTIELAEKLIAQGRKVVIACCYDDEIYTLKEYFGDKCVLYNGKMDLKSKDKAKKEFDENPNVVVFLGNIIAAGTGINLVVSNAVIFNNFDYVTGNCRQFEDRCYRIGQTKDVDIYYQIFNGTQYERMWNTIMRKELVINQIIKKEDEK